METDQTTPEPQGVFPEVTSEISESTLSEIHNECTRCMEDIFACKISAKLYNVRDVFTAQVNKGEFSLKGLYRDGLLTTLNRLGFYKRALNNGEFYYIKEVDNIIERVEVWSIRDKIIAIVNGWGDIRCLCEDKPYIVSMEEQRELFFAQQHLIFCDSFLANLPTHTKPILRDTDTESFFLFHNGVYVVTKDGVQRKDYSDIDSCVWKSHINDFDLDYTSQIEDNNDCYFVQFLLNVIPDEIYSMITGIGYVLHNRNVASVRKAFILNDAEITNIHIPQGGTGKGLIIQAISKMRETVIIDGKRLTIDDKFRWQQVEESTQVIVVDDLKQGTPFEIFHSAITEGLSVEKKHVGTIKLPPLQSPKIVISSNTAVIGEGNTNKRRQFVVELGNFYSKLGTAGGEPIRDTHGCEFFGDDWDQTEWNKFYCLMIGCVYKYLNVGLIPPKKTNLLPNKLRQLTNDDFATFVTDKEIRSGIKYDTSELFSEFRDTYYGAEGQFHQRTFTNWMRIFATIHSLKMDVKRSGGQSYFTLNSL